MEKEQKNTITRMLNYAVAAQDQKRQETIKNFCARNQLVLPEADGRGRYPYLEHTWELKRLLANDLQYKLKW